MEWVVVILAWLPIFMLGMYVGDVFKQKTANIVDDLETEAPKSSRKKVADRKPISIRPAFSLIGWHESDQDGDTLNEFFPKNERTASFADVPSPLGDEEAEVSPVRKFKTSEVRMYASGELKPVPEIRKKQGATPVCEQKSNALTKTDRT